MATILVPRPQAGQQLAFSATVDSRFVLEFSADEFKLEKSSQSLLLVFDDGARLELADFYAAVNAAKMPDFVIGEQLMTGEDFFAALAPQLLPAPVRNARYAEARGEYFAQGESGLADGVLHLEALDWAMAPAFSHALSAEGRDLVPDVEAIDVPILLHDGSTALQPVTVRIGIRDDVPLLQMSGREEILYSGQSYSDAFVFEPGGDGASLHYSLNGAAEQTVFFEDGTASITTGRGVLELNSQSGSYTYTANAKARGWDRFAFRAVDGDGDVATAALDIHMHYPGTLLTVGSNAPDTEDSSIPHITAGASGVITADVDVDDNLLVGDGGGMGTGALLPCGNDHIRGGDTGYLLYGDAVNTDKLISDLGLADVMPYGSGYSLFQYLESHPEVDTGNILRGLGMAGTGPWNEEHSIAYISQITGWDHAAGGESLIRTTDSEEIEHYVLDPKGQIRNVDGRVNNTVRLEELTGREGGHDLILGGSGNEFIYAQEGNDLVFGGGSQDDNIYGGSGNDLLVDGGGAEPVAALQALVGAAEGTLDSISAAIRSMDAAGLQSLAARLEEGSGIESDPDGISYLYGGTGDDILIGGAGNNELMGNAGNDILFGAAGNEEMLGGAGDDWLFGGSGNDRLYGEEGVDRLYGGSGNDYLDGGPGGDWLYGEEGHDIFMYDAQDILIDGGEGTDVLLLANDENMENILYGLNAQGSQLQDIELLLQGDGLSSLTNLAGLDARGISIDTDGMVLVDENSGWTRGETQIDANETPFATFTYTTAAETDLVLAVKISVLSSGQGG